MSGNYTIVTAPPRLDGPVAEQLLGQLEAKLTESIQLRYLVLDLSAVGFISSAGIRYLIVASDQFRKRDGSVVLCGPSENVLQVLQITGLTRTFRIVPDTVSAVSELA